MTRLAIRTGLAIGASLLGCCACVASILFITWTLVYMRELEHMFFAGMPLAAGLTLLGVLAWLCISAWAIAHLLADIDLYWRRYSRCQAIVRREELRLVALADQPIPLVNRVPRKRVRLVAVRCGKGGR